MFHVIKRKDGDFPVTIINIDQCVGDLDLDSQAVKLSKSVMAVKYLKKFDCNYLKRWLE